MIYEKENGYSLEELDGLTGRIESSVSFLPYDDGEIILQKIIAFESGDDLYIVSTSYENMTHFESISEELACMFLNCSKLNIKQIVSSGDIRRHKDGLLVEDVKKIKIKIMQSNG